MPAAWSDELLEAAAVGEIGTNRDRRCAYFEAVARGGGGGGGGGVEEAPACMVEDEQYVHEMKTKYKIKRNFIEPLFS